LATITMAMHPQNKLRRVIKFGRCFLRLMLLFL